MTVKAVWYYRLIGGNTIYGNECPIDATTEVEAKRKATRAMNSDPKMDRFHTSAPRNHRWEPWWGLSPNAGNPQIKYLWRTSHSIETDPRAPLGKRQIAHLYVTWDESEGESLC